MVAKRQNIFKPLSFVFILFFEWTYFGMNGCVSTKKPLSYKLKGLRASLQMRFTSDKTLQNNVEFLKE